jgi:Domain of unknown function (DUF6438)
MRPLFLALLALGLAACANPPVTGTTPDRPAQPEAASGPTAITFEAGPCYGFCPDFSVTVSADGAVRYEGRRFTQRQGVHMLPRNPALFQRLRDLTISPSLPWPRGNVQPGLPTCQTEVSDLPSYSLRTSGPSPRGFEFYAGCRGPDADRARRLVDAVMAALAAHGVPTEGVRPERGER